MDYLSTDRLGGNQAVKVGKCTEFVSYCGGEVFWDTRGGLEGNFTLGKNHLARGYLHVTGL